MKKSNKIVAVLLALVMIISAVPMMTVSAATCNHKYIVAEKYENEDCTEPDVTVYWCVKCNDKVEVYTGASTHKDLGKIKKDDWNPEEHYQICGDCGVHVYSEHNFVDVKVKTNPTCVAYGEKRVKCSDCGFTIENVQIEPVGHQFDTIIENNDAHTGKCKVCNETITEAHIWSEGEVTTKPQCAANGVMTYQCTKCNAKRTANTYEKIVILLGDEVKADEDFAKIEKRHTYADKAVKSSEKAHKYVCTVPGCGRVATEAEMNAMGKTLKHDFVVEVLGTSSCVVDGYDDTLALHITCKDCDLDITTKNAEHDFDEFEVENATQHAQVCDKCGKEQLAEHNWKDVKVTKEATCKETGEKKVVCKDCEYETTVVIPKLEEHKWDKGEVTKEATCGAEGVKTFTCTVCGEKKTEKIAAAGEHKWGAWTVVIPATPLIKGTKARECEVCGKKETATFEYESTERKLGDVNGDGNVAATDARMILQHVAELRILTDEEKKAADLNEDGQYTAVDARMILQAVAAGTN